jgi:hypothetical protein
MTGFRLEILEQRWGSAHDYSAHGRVRATIGGVVVTSDDPNYGITQSALALLRTVENDRVEIDSARGVPFDSGFLLCHDCGYPISFGCSNFGTNWWVTHTDDEVVLSWPGANPHAPLEVRLPVAAYAAEIVAFAREAKRFYWTDHDAEVDEQGLHQAFWAEFDERLIRAERLVAES